MLCSEVLIKYSQRVVEMWVAYVRLSVSSFRLYISWTFVPDIVAQRHDDTTTATAA